MAFDEQERIEVLGPGSRGGWQRAEDRELIALDIEALKRSQSVGANDPARVARPFEQPECLSDVAPLVSLFDLEQKRRMITRETVRAALENR